MPNIVQCTNCSDDGACRQHSQDCVHCARCAGTGQFVTGMLNGVPTGPGGVCFRCGGKGYHNPRDRKRNAYYDRFCQRVRV